MTFCALSSTKGMGIKMRKTKRLRLGALLVAVCLVIATFAGQTSAQAEEKRANSAEGAEIEGNIVNLRFIGTTDIHGQVTSTDLETGKKNVHGGIEKLLTVIRGQREEFGEANTFTFDTGDTVFDYTTENIFTTDSTALQPVWKAYKEIGYDAFTLGNHDFDYGYNYMVEQLNQAGLMGNCVVSNVWKTASGEYPFGETKLINRVVTATNGTQVLMKIGVIGETIPVLSQKTEVMTGELTTEGMVKNATEKAKKLKEKGADLIIVLAHSGIGEEEPEELAKNAAYALTKIPEVDIVFCGHEHRVFPGGDKDADVYAMPNTDPATGLVNGKNLVMPGSRGDNVGVVDLSCEIVGEEAVIKQRSTRVLSIDPNEVESAPEISEQIYGEFLEMFEDHHSRTIATITEGITYHNYFGMLEDNAAVQLVNSAKIAYALKYQNSVKGSKYAGLPVVACSGYSYQDAAANHEKIYGEITGAITGADLRSLQTYHAYIVIYEVTGAQLKEFMEWSASAYATLNEEQEWEDAFMSLYQKTSGFPALYFEDWWEDWSSFRIFDGVEYTIDPSVAPRYSRDGIQINNTSRVKNVTINGVPVKDTDKLLLSCDRIINPTDSNKSFVPSSQLIGGYVSSQNFFASWLEECAKTGEISMAADHNWSLKLPPDYVFLANSSIAGEKYAPQEDWYVSKYISNGDTSYYMGIFRNTEDTYGPNLVVTPNVTVPTNNNVTLAVSVNDISGVKQVTWLKRAADAEDKGWSNAAAVKEGKVSVESNGTYTFRAEDNKGNVTFVTVAVDNIDKSLLEIPYVNSYTNRKASISGTAEPEATVYIKAGSKAYQAKVGKDGEFSYALPNQPSGTKLEVYVKDNRGRVSDVVTVQVKRTGPNRPSLSAYVKNTQTKIKGKTNDDDAVPVAVIGDTVYGSSAGLERYRYSELYKAGQKLVKTTVKVESSSAFTIKIPVQKAGTVVTLYNLDSDSRISRKRASTVQEKAPNQPELYPGCSLEREVRGVVELLNKKDRYTITVTIGGRTYTGETEEDGSFCVDTGRFAAGTEVSVVASDGSGETLRTSAAASSAIEDYRPYMNSALVFDPVYVGDKSVSGMYKPGGLVTVILGMYSYSVECGADGRFEVETKTQVYASSDLYAVARDGNQIVSAQIATILKPSEPETPDSGNQETPDSGNQETPDSGTPDSGNQGTSDSGI